MKRLLTASVAAALALGMSGAASAEPIKNVVLVHGAFADGSGWHAVADILERDGYSVSIVQEPETSLADDAAATKRIIERVNAPLILVGHSYGGAVITQAGNEPQVRGLVYIAAFQPDSGEVLGGLLKQMPPAANNAVPAGEGYVIGRSEDIPCRLRGGPSREGSPLHGDFPGSGQCHRVRHPDHERRLAQQAELVCGRNG